MNIQNLKSHLPDLSQYKRFPSWAQWKQFPGTLTGFEKFALTLFIVLLLGSGIFLGLHHRYVNTVLQPAPGGSFTEGMTGQPRFINPVYVSSNDVDRSLVQLTFAGLMQYDQNGEIVPDLAKSYHTEQGKTWTVTLKKNITWQDGEPITAEDVVFTVNILQDSNYKSPQRVNWVGVDVSRVSSRKVKFTLTNAYPQFLENLTLKVIPKHVWKDIQPANFSLSSYNLKPIGSGPFQVSKVNQRDNRIKSIVLTRNSNYHQQPYLDRIVFKFYNNEDQLLKAARQGEVDGFSVSTSTQVPGFNSHQFSLPRYFAVFFNQDQSKLLTNDVRKALNYATNRKQIVKQVLNGQGHSIYSPILPSIYGFQSSRKYRYDLKRATQLLKQEGFKDSNGDGIRERTQQPEFQFGQRLERGMENEAVKELQQCLVKEVNYSQDKVTGYFGNTTQQGVIDFQEKYEEEVLKPYDLQSGTGIVGPSTRNKLNQVCFEQPQQPLTVKLTLVRQPEMKQVAQLLKKQWKKAGVKLKLNPVPLSELKTNYIKTRDYQSLLFGESLGIKPDFYSFWHSSQTKDPGLNLAKFESEQADQLLEQARTTMDQNDRAKLYQEFQQLLLKQAPAVFLYNPNFVYHVSKIKGINSSLIVNPAHRFASVKKWYLNTKRVWR